VACTLTVCGSVALAPWLLHVAVYGAVVMGTPTGAPSTKNCTLASGTSSSMTADRATWPVTTLPSTGADRVIAGGTCWRYADSGERAPDAPAAKGCGSAARLACALVTLLPPLLAWRRFSGPAPSGLSTTIQ